MNKALTRTIAILIIIMISIGLGYAYERVAIILEKKSHPIPAAYKDIVEKYAEEFDVPIEIVYSVINTESGFRSDAVSPGVGAVGLMQIMPDTFDWIAMKLGEKPTEGLLYDPHTNVKYGTFFLKYLYKEFGSWDIAFAAYNAGPNRVKQWLNNPEYIIDNEIVYIPIEETRNYIKKVNKNKEAYKRLYFSKDN
jgi:soluble lytic murein transglycosylase